jgi:isopentenyl diphosphate isomerase/L-lactate dehydrogenase-like FMN-dependent dehydrogenase
MPVFDPAGVQRAIYFNGLSGTLPALPMTAEGWEAAARERMAPEAFAYIAGGAGSEHTVRANLAAFERRRVVPRMLREVGPRNFTTTVLGKQLSFPLLAAPIGVMSLAHEDGELAAARATSKLGLTQIVSTAASRALEDVAAAAPDGSRWFQLYWPKDVEVAESFVRRADLAGYEAIVVTLDTWSLGWRPRDLALAHLPFLRGNGIANYLADPVFRSKLRREPEESQAAFTEAVMLWAASFGNPALRWSDIKRLREWTTLPIVLKGILHPDDARAALDAGVDGIVVSNHGGRQVDRSIASLDALPAVAAAVAGKASVLFDSGIRCGGDILIALALGAQAVLIGRPYVYGLALAGEEGVAHVFRCLLADLDASLALAGRDSVAALDPSVFAAG